MNRQIEKIPSDTMRRTGRLALARQRTGARKLPGAGRHPFSGTTLRAPLAELREDSPETAGGETLEQVEREHIIRMLQESDGVVTAAAVRLGLHRTTLNAMMRKLGISRKDF